MYSAKTNLGEPYQRPLKQGVRPFNKWAKLYDSCIKCSSTQFPHRAKGLCSSCYLRDWIDRETSRLGAPGNTLWHVRYKCCIVCGTKERPHSAHCRCKVCDGKWCRSNPKTL